MDFDQNVKLKYDDLSDSEKEMVTYIRSNISQVIDSSITNLADKMLSSKSSVLRLAKKLGYHGFTEMKYSLKENIDQEANLPTDLIAKLENDIQQTLHYVNQTNFQPLLDKIYQAENLIVYATGFSQNNCTKEFSNDLFIVGRKNYLVSGEANFALNAETLGPKDLVIVVGLSGNTPGIKDTIITLNMNNVPLCSVTSFGKNFLSEHARYNLYYETSTLPSKAVNQPVYSYVCLTILLSVLNREYREFILYDE